MAEYDYFIDTEFEKLAEDQEIVGVLRDLSPGKAKYRSFRARFMISKDPNKYPDNLWIRLPRGQLVETPCSVRILEVLPTVEM